MSRTGGCGFLMQNGVGGVSGIAAISATKGDIFPWGSTQRMANGHKMARLRLFRLHHLTPNCHSATAAIAAIAATIRPAWTTWTTFRTILKILTFSFLSFLSDFSSPLPGVFRLAISHKLPANSYSHFSINYKL
ncbi:MAG: hypothetical protein JNM70_15635 [Anaerolineae bacterium]|nr:hypothetical protein [Anaerolineae bacterium]